MKRLITLSFLTMFLTGCMTSGTEMPYEPEGSDEMRKSPCACLTIEYEPITFEWVDAFA